MGLKNDIVLAHAAPAAGMALTGLDEINRTLVLRPPRFLHHLEKKKKWETKK